MSLDNCEDFESEHAEANLSGERRQLSDIINIGMLLALTWRDNQETDPNESDGEILQKEICSLKKCLARNVATVELQNLEIQKAVSTCHIAQKHNRELVQRNGQLLRELGQNREKLKLLMHEYKQMSAMYRFKLLELEQKVIELSGELQCMQETRHKGSGKNQNERRAPCKRTSSRQSRKLSRHKSGDIFNKSSFANAEKKSDRRLSLRRCSYNVCYKEPSLHTKLRREEQTRSLPRTSSASDRCSGSFGGQSTMGKACDNALSDSSCLPQSKTMLEELPASKKSSGGLQNGSVCSKEANWNSDIKQRQETEQAATCRVLLNAVSKETLLSRRPSTGRPIRKATECVTSYKEIPINIKLRRPN